MAVTDDEVAALRAHLNQDFEVARRLNTQLAKANVDGYAAVSWASFVLSVRRRFAPKWTVPEVVTYVAALRARWGRDADDIDPRAAETLMRRALDDEVASDLDEVAMG